MVACAQSGLLDGVEVAAPQAWADGLAGVDPLDWRLVDGALVYAPRGAEPDPLADLAELVIDNTLAIELLKLQTEGGIPGAV